ncbi:MAG: hypothetical protein RMJ82_15645, partial [Gemmatales bacterium]|nr:hypothetical protein [Gemmatales bacterium]
ELCKVALWIESNTGDKPLTFLDHRIRCGDSLVGVFNLATLGQGIPDGAFKPLSGDDRDAVRSVKERNRNERSGQRDLFDAAGELEKLSQSSQAIEAISDNSPAEVRKKRESFAESRKASNWLRTFEAANLWTAAFFQWFQPQQRAITTAAVADRLANEAPASRAIEVAHAIAQRQRFFHWHLEFPEVFAVGGFDVVLCN